MHEKANTPNNLTNFQKLFTIVNVSGDGGTNNFCQMTEVHLAPEFSVIFRALVGAATLLLLSISFYLLAEGIFTMCTNFFAHFARG